MASSGSSWADCRRAGKAGQLQADVKFSSTGMDSPRLPADELVLPPTLFPNLHPTGTPTDIAGANGVLPLISNPDPRNNLDLPPALLPKVLAQEQDFGRSAFSLAYFGSPEVDRIGG